MLCEPAVFQVAVAGGAFAGWQCCGLIVVFAGWTGAFGVIGRRIVLRLGDFGGFLLRRFLKV